MENKTVTAVICAAAAALIIAAIVVFAVLRKKRHGGSGYTDDLTGLGNLKAMNYCFYKQINLYLRHYCLIYIAYDAELLSKKHGEEKNEELQKFTAKVINEALGDYDYAARIDDGAFVIFSRSPDIKTAEQKTAELVDMLNRYVYQLVGDHIASFAAGMYALGTDGESCETALWNAKLGYSHACETKINLCICTDTLLRAESSRKRMRTKLMRAIDNKEFEPFIQFVYDPNKKKFIGGEVLSRWNDPVDGFVMPGHYINDMRNTGVITRFDYYMLDRTCRILEKWKKEGKGDLRLSCNMTRISISDPEYISNLRSIVKKYDFDYDRLILEITEDALVDTTAVAYSNIVDCKTAGFCIAIDDFGAGHSSFSDICDYPADIIKVDRYIITKSTTERGGALIKGLVKLAHDLGMEVLCEGVETEEQDASVTAYGCDYVQGYFHSYVFPLAEAEEYYAESLSK